MIEQLGAAGAMRGCSDLARRDGASMDARDPIRPGPMISVRHVVGGAFCAWLVVLAIFAWLILRAPQWAATWFAAGISLPGITDWALQLLAWMRTNSTTVGLVALVPLVLLVVMRKAVVAMLALGLVFCAGAVAGALAVALWLPEAQLRNLRSLQDGSEKPSASGVIAEPAVRPVRQHAPAP